MRQAHWLKPNHKSEYPHDCVWFDTETLEERVSSQAVRHVLDFGMAAYRRRLRGDQWSRPKWLRFTTPEGLNRLYPGLAGLPRFDPPWLAGLRLEVADLNSTAAYLDTAGVRYLRDGVTLLRVPSDFACGVVVEFAVG